jgi:hypothetical protein
MAHDAGNSDSSSKPATDNRCGCNKCLAKRAVANDSAQAPAVAWAVAAFLPVFHTDDLFVSSGSVCPRFVIDSGPLHDRREILARHHALLL